MRLSPLQVLVIIVILAGVCYGTYSATMDILPDVTGTIVGNTTSNANNTTNTTNSTNITNQTLGTVYIQPDDDSSNMSIIITTSTKIYKESNGEEVESSIDELQTGAQVDVYTIGKSTNTIPPQIKSEKIVIKEPTESFFSRLTSR